MKVKEPVAEEYPRLAARANQILFTYLHLAASRPCTDALLASGNVAIAYETVRRRDNSLPLLAPISEVAGRMAPLMGAHHLMRTGGGRGTLICGVPGVGAANVVVIGAGVSGTAAAIALGMHANVKILDKNLDRLSQLDHTSRARWKTIASSAHAIERRVATPTSSSGGTGRRSPGSQAREQRSGRPHARRIGARRHRRRPGRLLRGDAPDHALRSVFEVTARSSTAWRTCPAPCRRRRRTRSPNATLPYLLELARRGWREAARLDDALAEGVNVVTARSPTDPSPTRTASRTPTWSRCSRE